MTASFQIAAHSSSATAIVARTDPGTPGHPTNFNLKPISQTFEGTRRSTREMLKPFPHAAMDAHWEGTDEQWKFVEPIWHPAPWTNHRGRPRHDARAVLSDGLQRPATGAQWSGLQKRRTVHQTCAHRLQQWVRDLTLMKAFAWSHSIGASAILTT